MLPRMSRSRLRRLLLPAYVALGVANLVANAVRSLPAEVATKPLLMPLLAAHVGTRLSDVGLRRPDQLLLAALGFSTLGDIALLGESDTAFLAGLGSFLLAQVSYLGAFRAYRGQGPVAANHWLVVPFGAWWVVLIGLLYRDLGDLLVPVAIYGAVLVTMAGMAWRVSTRVGLGAALFVVSDSLIALTSLSDRFGFDGSRVAVMATYLAGQGLIATGWVDRRLADAGAPAEVAATTPAPPRAAAG